MARELFRYASLESKGNKLFINFSEDGLKEFLQNLALNQGQQQTRSAHNYSPQELAQIANQFLFSGYHNWESNFKVTGTTMQANNMGACVGLLNTGVGLVEGSLNFILNPAGMLKNLVHNLNPATLMNSMQSKWQMLLDCDDFTRGKFVGQVGGEAILWCGPGKLIKISKGAKAVRVGVKGVEGASNLGKLVNFKNIIRRGVAKPVNAFEDLLGKICGKETELGCFTAGTPVSTADGQRPIEEVNVDDYVWSENPETGEKALKKVIKTFIHDKYTLMHVHTEDTMVETTEEHPFWVEGKGWTFVGELNEGDVLRLKSGENVKVTKLKRVDLEEPVKVYNFEVEDWHTYYVSDINVLVHNKAMMNNLIGNCNKVDVKYLKKNGINAHQLKYDLLGDNAPIAQYDIYIEKTTKELVIFKKGGKGPGISTDEFIK